MQKKQIFNSEPTVEFTDTVRARIVRSFRRLYKAMDKHRDTIDTVLEVFGTAADVIALIFGIDLGGVSLIAELLKLLWELSGSPRFRAAVTAWLGWLRRVLHQGAAAGRRARRGVTARVRAGVRRGRRAFDRLQWRLRATAHRIARRALAWR